MMTSTSTGARFDLRKHKKGLSQGAEKKPWVFSFLPRRRLLTTDHRKRPSSSILFSLTPSLPLFRSLFPTSRHVVLPQDIAQLLPKGKLLSEVRSLHLFGGRRKKEKAVFFCPLLLLPALLSPLLRPRLQPEEAAAIWKGGR